MPKTFNKYIFTKLHWKLVQFVGFYSIRVRSRLFASCNQNAILHFISCLKHQNTCNNRKSQNQLKCLRFDFQPFSLSVYDRPKKQFEKQPETLFEPNKKTTNAERGRACLLGDHVVVYIYTVQVQVRFSRVSMCLSKQNNYGYCLRFCFCSFALTLSFSIFLFLLQCFPGQQLLCSKYFDSFPQSTSPFVIAFAYTVDAKAFQEYFTKLHLVLPYFLNRTES